MAIVSKLELSVLLRMIMNVMNANSGNATFSSLLILVAVSFASKLCLPLNATILSIATKNIKLCAFDSNKSIHESPPRTGSIAVVLNDNVINDKNVIRAVATRGIAKGAVKGNQKVE